MSKFAHHIFVCGNRREPGNRRGCCDPEGRQVLVTRLKAEIARLGLNPLVRANKAGCLDQCELGPCLVIYPEAIWYGGVTPEDVPRIVKETILGGHVLEDLRLDDHLLNSNGDRASRASAADATVSKPCES